MPLPPTSKIFNNWFLHTRRTRNTNLKTLEKKQFSSPAKASSLRPTRHPNGPLGLSVLVVACACTLYIASVSIPGPRNAYGLRQPSQYPGLKFINELE